MRRLICAFVVRIWHKTHFLMVRLIYLCDTVQAYMIQFTDRKLYYFFSEHPVVICILADLLKQLFEAIVEWTGSALVWTMKSIVNAVWTWFLLKNPQGSQPLVYTTLWDLTLPPRNRHFVTTLVYVDVKSIFTELSHCNSMNSMVFKAFSMQE